MSSNSRLFTNPFDIPSKVNNSNQTKPNSKTSSSNKSNLTMHQKAAESLESFINYNPTLSSETQSSANTNATTTTTHASNYYPYANNHSTWNQQSNCNNKRTFHAMNGANYNHSGSANKRRKRQRYPNDGGLTDSQYETIMEARRNESEQDISKYIEQRKRNYPLLTNIERKREIINVKTKRGQLLSINERIMKYQDDTGNKKTPSVLRFLKTPKYDTNIVRKVLKKEIAQEHSAILQCFRYIIKTNYLTTDLEDREKDKREIQMDDELANAEAHNEIEMVSAFDMEQIVKDEVMMEQEEDDADADELDIDLDEILALQSETRVPS